MEFTHPTGRADRRRLALFRAFGQEDHHCRPAEPGVFFRWSFLLALYSSTVLSETNLISFCFTKENIDVFLCGCGARGSVEFGQEKRGEIT